MSMRALMFILLVLPLGLLAQEPGSSAPPDTLNATTRAVLLANRPEHVEEAEWLRVMERPVNRTLYPLRITQVMLDTLDGRLLDRRFQYILVNER